MKGNTRFFKRFLLSAGLGAGVHFNTVKRIKYLEEFGHGGIRSLDDLNDPDRYHRLFRETYEAAMRIHRRFTFNYHLAVGYALLKRLDLIVHFDQSIGRIHRKMRIDNVEYDYRLEWSSVGVMLTYRFSLAKAARGVADFFKPEIDEE